MKTKKPKATANKPALVVHGGCGSVPRQEEAPRNAACERAAQAGWKVLQAGGSALDAVETVVRRLEDEPLLNAGTGSYLQADGVSRVDASLMDSRSRAGCVVQAPLLKNPIRLARYILEQEAHIMLSGPEAVQLALRLGHATGVLARPAKIAYWVEHLNESCQELDYAAMAQEWKNTHPRLGTVGCVALDRTGRLAAGTSTGGTGQCYPGRVGDTPVLGAGTYCTRQAGVSMTGVGERVLVLLSAKSLCDRVADGLPLQAAAQSVLQDLEGLAKASAGLIALDVSGTIVEMKNTAYMAYAVRR
jgi:beta-aspartyl-peptidase (threonine type)